MPKIAAEISAPISQTNKITMVAGGDGPIGASRITSEVNIQGQGRNVGGGRGRYMSLIFGVEWYDFWRQII